MRRVLVFVLLGVGWAMMVAAGIAVWLHYFRSRGEVTIFLTSAVPFAIIPAVLAVIVFVALRRWLTLPLAIAALVALCITQVPLWVSQTPPAGERFTVLTANLMVGGGDVDQIAEVVERERVDLVSLQEVTPEALDRLQATVGRQLTYSYAVPGPFAQGTAIFSRSPLTDQAEIDENTVLHNLRARTDLPGARDTQVFAVHPGAPLRGKTDIWVRDMDLLRTRLEAIPSGRAIVAGDFNATWDQVRYRDFLQHGFADTVDQSGAGFVPTYPTDKWGGRPFLALDHVVVRGFVASKVDTFDLGGSDHRAVVVSLVAS
ncbi:endonuclease/exonuclease/phosphatase family protein [Gordonia aichiensis]